MAVPLVKLAVVIGAGLVGSAVTKEGGLSGVTKKFSGALKAVTKHLQHDKDNSRSSRKPQIDFDSLSAQVNSIRQNMQLLASRPCTIVTGNTSGSGAFAMTTVIIVGFVGYGYIWWKGWKLSDVMFVTRRGLSDACTSIGKQLELVSSSLAAAKRHLSSRVDAVDRKLEECKELTVATKHEETKLGKLEGNQEVTARGIYHLCDFVQRCEQSRNTEPIQASLLISQEAIELPENTPVARMDSLPPLALEPPLPSASMETPKVLRPAMTVSASGIKKLQEISSALKSGNFRTSSTKASNGTLAADESSTSTPSSSRFGWKLPGISILSRTNNSAS